MDTAIEKKKWETKRLQAEAFLVHKLSLLVIATMGGILLIVSVIVIALHL